MIFPETQRVIYKKNPLAEVICQLRFPPILRIDAELPVSFQEDIRAEYPLYETVNTETAAVLGEIVSSQLADLLRQNTINAYNFTSIDKDWRIGLTRDFLALSANKYERWESFKAHLEKPLEALEKNYAPRLFTRIGLRYRDVINKNELGLANVPWSQLLQPHIAGEFMSPNVGHLIHKTAKQVIITDQDNQVQILLQHGLNQNDKAEIYVIDSDFFTEVPTETGDVINILDKFNTYASRLFRWCITDRLANAMEPTPL